MRSPSILFIAGLLSVASALSEQALESPQFDVNSVRQSGPHHEEGPGLWLAADGRLDARNCTLKQLIQTAYHVESFRIQGGPGWVTSDRFTVQAKGPLVPINERAPSPFRRSIPPEVRKMLQVMLADRFKLTLRHETQERSVLALTSVSEGPQLKSSRIAADPSVTFTIGSAHGHRADISTVLTGKHADMALLAHALAQRLRRPVIDRTGIDGSYDFEFEFADQVTQADAAPYLSRALKTQLGLKLETQKGPVEILLIDHAEKPTEN
jgi:uncharacterized protein (TIGR03435 family)